MRFSIPRRAALALPALLGRPARAQSVSRPARIVIGFPPGGSSDVVGAALREGLRGTYAPHRRRGPRRRRGRIAVDHVRGAEPDGLTILQIPASMLTLQTPCLPARGARRCAGRSHPGLHRLHLSLRLRGAEGPPGAIPARLDRLGQGAGAGTALGLAGGGLGAAFHRHHARPQDQRPAGAHPLPRRCAGGAGPDRRRLACFIGVLGDVSAHHGRGAAAARGLSRRRATRASRRCPPSRRLGHPDLNKDEWFGALLPAGTPAATVAALHRAIRAAAEAPEMVAALERLEYANTTSDSPAAFAARIRQEWEDWGVAVRHSGVPTRELTKAEGEGNFSPFRIGTRPLPQAPLEPAWRERYG